MRATGFTPSLFEATWILQAGCCALCGIGLALVDKETNADHGEVGPRGILCGPCNRSLGHFEKLWARRDRVLAYLEYPPAQELIHRG